MPELKLGDYVTRKRCPAAVGLITVVDRGPDKPIYPEHPGMFPVVTIYWLHPSGEGDTNYGPESADKYLRKLTETERDLLLLTVEPLEEPWFEETKWKLRAGGM